MPLQVGGRAGVGGATGAHPRGMHALQAPAREGADAWPTRGTRRPSHPDPLDSRQSTGDGLAEGLRFRRVPMRRALGPDLRDGLCVASMQGDASECSAGLLGRSVDDRRGESMMALIDDRVLDLHG